jgi:hypothetical protein
MKMTGRKKAHKTQRGEAATKTDKAWRCAKENNPPLLRWAVVQEDKSSPVRDESPVVHDGTFMACLAGGPSHKWLGYSREIFLVAVFRAGLFAPVCGHSKSAIRNAQSAIELGLDGVSPYRAGQSAIRNAQSAIELGLDGVSPYRAEQSAIP